MFDTKYIDMKISQTTRNGLFFCMVILLASCMATPIYKKDTIPTEAVSNVFTLNSPFDSQLRKAKEANYLRFAGIALPIISLFSLVVAISALYKNADTFITNEVRIDSTLIKKDVIRYLTNHSRNANKNDSANCCK